MSLYEFVLLGEAAPADVEFVANRLRQAEEEFGLPSGAIALRSDGSVPDAPIRAATVAAYFAGNPDRHAAEAGALVDDGLPVIPTKTAHQRFERDLPAVLRSLNGLTRGAGDDGLIELTVAMMECVGLLRRQRRLFVSYRRDEAQAVAIQLFNELSSRGFAVFLDTHVIRPGAQFQEELWHQMCDSDVVLMLDTETYFDSRWTREEIAKARAKNLQVLRVIWPGLVPSRLTDLSETLYLDPAEIDAAGHLAEHRLKEVAERAEWLRSRSIASRHRLMADALRSDVIRIGGAFEGVGAHRAMALRLLSDRRVWAYPVIGVPTAETLHEVHSRNSAINGGELPLLVYDDVGLRREWAEHLSWLGEQIPAVRWVPAAAAAWNLAGLED